MEGQYFELDPRGDAILILDNSASQQDQGEHEFDGSPPLPAVLLNEPCQEESDGKLLRFLKCECSGEGVQTGRK